MDQQNYDEVTRQLGQSLDEGAEHLQSSKTVLRDRDYSGCHLRFSCIWTCLYLEQKCDGWHSAPSLATFTAQMDFM